MIALSNDAARTALADTCGTLLEELVSHQDALRGLLGMSERKLESLRRADTIALHTISQEETEAVDAIASLDARRNAVLARLAQLVPDTVPQRPRLSEIAAVVPEPFSSQILAKTLGLRDLAEKLQRKNRLAAAVARGLQDHIRAVFAEAASANCEAVAYGRNGKADERVNRNWVDAVG